MTAQLFGVVDDGEQVQKYFVVFLPTDASGSLIALDSEGKVLARNDFDSATEAPDLQEFRIEGMDPCDPSDHPSGGDGENG